MRDCQQFRRTSLKCLGQSLQEMKRKLQYIPIQCFEVSGVERSLITNLQMPKFGNYAKNVELTE